MRLFYCAVAFVALTLCAVGYAYTTRAPLNTNPGTSCAERGCCPDATCCIAGAPCCQPGQPCCEDCCVTGGDCCPSGACHPTTKVTKKAGSCCTQWDC